MNGQQTQAQVVVPDAVTVAALLLPVTTPGSPEPWSPVVPCHGAGPSSNPGSAVAVSVTGPLATHVDCAAAVEVCLPDTDTEHQDWKFLTVNSTGVAPEHVGVDVEDTEPPPP